MPAKAPKTSRHLEVERKFDVVESTVSPSFEGIAAVVRVEKSPTQSLDATYFDTPVSLAAVGAQMAARGLNRQTDSTIANLMPKPTLPLVESVVALADPKRKSDMAFHVPLFTMAF